MHEYLLIMRHEDGGKVASPEQMQIWMKQTMDWLAGIEAQGKLLPGGNGLSFDDSRVVDHNKMVTKGPFGDIKETIGGYVRVKAESADDAAELAKGCPVLQGEGNTMEIRKIALHES